MTFMINSALVALLLATTACSSAPRRSEAPPPVVAKDFYFLSKDAAKRIDVGPPPPLGSPQDQKDMADVKQAQQERTDEDCRIAKVDAAPPPPGYAETFGDIGPFPLPLSEEARGFWIRIWSDMSIVSEGLKRKYNWPRVYAVDPSIVPCLNKSSNPAFPSGHATGSRLTALVLSELVPEKRQLFIERADRIALYRVIGGMHRPSETAAGKELAAKIFAELLKSRSFRRDLADMKASLSTAASSVSGR